MKIRAFRGLRYASDPTDPGTLAAPPFDQIDPSLRDRLHAIPHHFAHLTRPMATGGDSPYRQAARLHDAWRTSGCVTLESTPCLYPYEIVLPGGGRRLGLCCLIDLEPPESGVIRPHERTVDKTIDERRRLLEETAADLEPILLFTDDQGGLERLVEDDLSQSPPLVEHRDISGNLHRLHAVTDSERVLEYQRTLAPLAALIADGHHRYRTAWLHAQDSDAPADSLVRTKLAVLSSLASPELSIDPIHRGLSTELDLAALGGAIRHRSIWEGSSGEDLARAVADAPQPALGVRVRGRQAELWQLQPGLEVGDLPPAATQLSVVVLHRALLAQLGMGPETATDGTIVYRSDADTLWREVESGDLATGFWLPSMPGDLFAAATEDGQVLPPKSTRFLPKLASGLVWCSRRDGD